MFIEMHGEGGKPLVVIRGAGGLGQGGASACNLMPRPSDYGRVIFVEWENDERSDGFGAYAKRADDVVGMLTCFEIGRADFLDISRGGWTILQIAIRHPGVIDSIVPVCRRGLGCGLSCVRFWKFRN